MISLMTQINDNIDSKYVINNNMVSVILKYFINNITKGLIQSSMLIYLDSDSVFANTSDIEYFLQE